MVIRNNIAGLRTYNASRKTVGSIKKNLEKLSSGYRINRAADDAAGLGVSERIMAKVTELDRAQTNAEEGMDLARTADAALQEVNDMLKRARSLCIEAENGTYSDQELAAISDEMNQLFGEIDRISAGSYHNSICLFRNGVGHTYHEEYDESYTPTGDDNLQVWGQMDFIETKEFEEAEDAVPAKVSFELSDDIDLNDVNSLNSTVLRIGSYTYYFGQRPSSISSSSYYTHGVSLGSTVERAMQNLANATGYAVSLDKVTRTVTMTAPLRDWQYNMYDQWEIASKGDGDYANGTTVYFPEDTGSLETVTVSSDRAYSTPVKLDYSFGNGKTGTISAEDLKDLKCNTLNMRLYKNNSSSYSTLFSVKFTDAILGSTWEDFGNHLATEIGNKTGFDATYSGGKLSVEYTPTSVSTQSKIQIYITNGKKEDAVPGIVKEPAVPAADLGKWKSTGINFTVKSVQKETGAEVREVCTLEVEPVSSFPCSFNYYNTSYLYYNRNDPAYTAALNSAEAQGRGVLDTDADEPRNVTSITTEAVANEVQRLLGNNFNSSYYAITREGNKFTITSKTVNTTIESTLKSMFKPVECEITATRPYKPAVTEGGHGVIMSNYVIPDKDSNTQTANQTTTIDLGADINALQGKCFYLGSRYFEFTNSADAEGGSKDADYIDIDLSAYDTHDKIKDFVAGRLGSGYTLTVDGNNLKITSTSTFSAFSSAVVGVKQLSKSGTVKFDGGVDAGHSQTVIDFSSINEENLDTLLGKGFRIRCATCSGEYINVVFCWTNDGQMPESFEKKDPVTGITRTIHNIPVELSKVTSADKIVESIVEQVSPQLHHYTDVAVGDPPTTLIAMERRHGDVPDNNGGIALGSVETGVETNFVYNVGKKLVPDPLEGDLEEFMTTGVDIYVGSDPEPQVIPIHLPYIDLYHLRLKPPEAVDLTSEDQDPADWLGRVDRADRAISSARGTIGADYNRLEHAIQDLSNAHIQLSDAYSVIRDTDMADLMMKQIKDQILIQSQQSMQAQANQLPQGVLRLMQ